MNYDYLIVGSGLTGAVLARMLHDRGHRVLVLDRRSHMGGNAHDAVHESGIRYHVYGPHLFRTSSEKIWQFVNRFCPFYRYEHQVMTLVDGKLEHWPVVASYIKRVAGEDWQPAFRGEPGNFEEASLSMMPEIVYQKFVKPYTEKQWGVPAASLEANLAKRFDVREDDEVRFKTSKYQGIPKDGYTALLTSILDGIEVRLNVDYLESRDSFSYREGLIFTGPIDEFFGYRLGKLGYRSQKREHEFITDVQMALPTAVVNNPDPSDGEFIRTIEWKRIMHSDAARDLKGTLLTRETPFTPDNPDSFEYPFPDAANRELCRKYRALAADLDNVLICGRLGEYRYFDMDQAIARALTIFERVFGQPAGDHKGDRAARSREVFESES